MRKLQLGLPLALGSAQLKNRLCFSGHVTNLSDGPHLTKRHLAYLEERISGGIGLLVCDPLPIHQSSDTLRTKLSLTAETRDGFKALTDACHRQDVPAVVQLYHVGAHGCAKTAFAPAWSPSGGPSLRDQDGSHEMTSSEINILLESFINHAEEAKKAGFDGIEILAGGNMLLEQFWSALCNQRRDEWGGSFANRMAFSGELVQRIRAELGPAFLLGLVMTTDSGHGNSLKSEELEKILLYHDALDCVDYFSFCLDDAAGIEEAIAELKNYRKILKNGTLRVAGNVRNIETAEKILASGAADWLGMTRALIAEPLLMEKIQAGERRAIRPCVRCNQGCIGRRARDYTVACLVNPCAGREQQFPATLPKTEKVLRILIAGGGLAGMEAARSGAEAGHRITLMERGDFLGGQWRQACRIPGQEPFAELLDWYEYQFETLGIEPRLGMELGGKDVDDAHFDHLVIATGAGPTKTGFQRLLPNRSTLPGVESNKVYPVETVLEGTTVLSGSDKARVLLLDDIGFRQGIGTALFLAELGHTVTLLTRHAVPAPELLALGGHDKILARLDALGVELLTNSVLLSWSDDVVEYAGVADSAPVKRRFDFLVLATTNDANQQLENDMTLHRLPYSLAGDCQGARKAHMAIYEGRKAIMAIDRGEETC
jgi:2,4-dienoyl-CoA reductase-like NADH-dependent reductase (Old Yellow Enzyme family)/thioredoxin reductase